MRSLRQFLSGRRQPMLVLLLVALAVQALVPGGHMLAPTASHFVSVVPCPTSNPLARAMADHAERQLPATDHTAMGHGAMRHAGMDHAAMGHSPDSGADDGAQPASLSPKGECTFAGFTLAAGLPEQPQLALAVLRRDAVEPPPLQRVIVPAIRHLRPPLRAPPARA